MSKFEKIDLPNSQPTNTNHFKLQFRVALARWIYEMRGIRPGTNDRGFFADAAWDIMLDLYIADSLGKDISVTSASIASRRPLTTALRYIAELESSGWVVRRPDPADNRRFNLKLSSATFEEFTNFFNEAIRRFPAVNLSYLFKYNSNASDLTSDGSLYSEWSDALHRQLLDLISDLRHENEKLKELLKEKILTGLLREKPANPGAD